ncbi:MAG: hypothetical protein WC755_01100 [Candidatus Woesearchaeota archaeon]|jgi:hypothetical protein
MTYIVDTVLDVVKEISGKEPTLFQRDGILYVASDAGVGLVFNGFLTSDIRDNSKDKPKWFKESKSIIEKIEKDTVHFVKEEIPFVKAIAFGPDSNYDSLESIAKHAKEIASRDDGKIRMMEHGTTHRSHKYGYACDGFDVYATDARTMDRQKYLELLREKENQMLEQFQAWKEYVDEQPKGDAFFSDRLENSAKNIKVPKCIILTPTTLVSFPYDVELSSMHSRSNPWNKKTPFAFDETHFMKKGDYYENPYSLYVTLNKKEFSSNYTPELLSDFRNWQNESNGVVEAIESNRYSIDRFVRDVNLRHNDLYSKRINFHKGLREDARKRASIPVEQDLPF